MRLLLDTLAPVSHGTSERHKQLSVLSHRRDSREFQLQIRYRWRYALHGVGPEGAFLYGFSGVRVARFDDVCLAGREEGRLGGSSVARKAPLGGGREGSAPRGPAGRAREGRS